ncbi:methylaspartate mutase accessory protein GlmL [Mycoplasmatota bacterium zrk1]
MKLVLLTDFGSTYTKLTLIDLVTEEVISTAQSTTTVSTNILDGYVRAYNSLNIPGEIEEKLACSSAAGGLVVTAIGLVKKLTVEAAKRAALGAGAKVEYVYSNFITYDEIDEIKNSDTDIILLAGGTDGGNSESIIHNAKMLAEALIDIPIVLAGNKKAYAEIENLFKISNIYYRKAENVMPEINKLNVESAKEVIREIFIEKITLAKGIKQAEELVDNVIMPTPAAVLHGLDVLGQGTKNEIGIGDLLCVDVGGATTDIHSIAQGLPSKAGVVFQGLEEPIAKRTVEGDLGMRYSANALYETVGELTFKDYGLNDVKDKIEFRRKNTEFIAKEHNDVMFDIAMASICVDEAMSRHVGSVETIYSPMGMMYLQTGKDLSNLKYIIGTGGVVVNNDNIVEKALFNQKKMTELRPTDCEIIIDKMYILSSLSLLSVRYPDVALRMMKKYLLQENKDGTKE